jgi:hypothetical protein
MQIDIDMDRVTIEGQVVKRPDSVSRSEWMKWWESVKLNYSMLSEKMKDK